MMPVRAVELKAGVDTALLKIMIVALATGGALTPAFAHHAFSAEFDGNRPVTLTGKVTRMEWVNPHAWIHMDVETAEGTTESWAIEGAAPNALVRRGWNRNSLQPGTEITITGFLSRDGSRRANGREIILSDGSRLFAGSSGIGAPESHPDDATE